MLKCISGNNLSLIQDDTSAAVGLGDLIVEAEIFFGLTGGIYLSFHGCFFIITVVGIQETP